MIEKSGEILLRLEKGSELTHEEMDINFKILDAKAGKTIMSDDRVSLEIFSFSDEEIEKIIKNENFNIENPIATYEVSKMYSGVTEGNPYSIEIGYIFIVENKNDDGTTYFSVNTVRNDFTEGYVYSRGKSVETYFSRSIVNAKVYFTSNLINTGVVPKMSFITAVAVSN